MTTRPPAHSVRLLVSHSFDLLFRLDNLPNLATTADTMTAFNTKIDEIVDGKYIGKLDGAATDTKNALDVSLVSW